MRRRYSESGLLPINQEQAGRTRRARQRCTRGCRRGRRGSSRQGIGVVDDAASCGKGRRQSHLCTSPDFHSRRQMSDLAGLVIVLSSRY